MARQLAVYCVMQMNFVKKILRLVAIVCLVVQDGSALVISKFFLWFKLNNTSDSNFPVRPPSIPSSTQCCKERVYDGTTFNLAGELTNSEFDQKWSDYKYYEGEDDSLPICKDRCIYKKLHHENNLYCFPRSYSERENSCDSEIISPILCK